MLFFNDIGQFLANLESSDRIALIAVLISVVSFYLNRRHAKLLFHASQIPDMSIKPQPPLEKAFQVTIGNHSNDIEVRDLQIRSWVGLSKRLLGGRVLKWSEIGQQEMENILPGRSEALSIPQNSDKSVLDLVSQVFFKRDKTRLVEETVENSPLRLKVQISFAPARYGVKRAAKEKVFRIVSRKSNSDSYFLDLAQL